MSNSNDVARPEFPLSVKLDLSNTCMTGEDVMITIYDGVDRIRHQARGEVTLSLPIGLYTIRAEYASEISEQVIKHAGESQVTVSPIRHASPPLFGTATSHEYYAYPSREHSLHVTAEPLGNPANAESGLFLFVRMPNKELYNGQNLRSGLSLSDRDGRVLTRFATDSVMDETDGYMAYSAIAEPGLYILEFAGEPSRQMPIYVYRYWQTQVFAMYRERPLVEGATILLAHRGAGYNPDDRDAQAIDMALSGLQNNVETFPREMMRQMLYGKFDNPMLGLLALHLLLRRKETSEDDVNTILMNLEYLIPGAPDVDALRVMAAIRFRRNIPAGIAFSNPPMIRSAFEAMVAADAEHPEIVPDGEWVERLSLQLYRDSAWTTWLPLTDAAHLPDLTFNDSNGWSPQITLSVPWHTRKSEERKESEPKWVRDSISELVTRARRTDRKVDLNKFANDVNLPLRLVKRVYDEIISSG